MNKYESNTWTQMPQGAMRPGGLQLTGQLLQLAALENRARILDIGCGLGSTVGKLNELGYRAMGVDSSQKLIEKGRIEYPDTHLLVADGADLPFDAGSFDAVICECSLSVMPAQHVLAECNRLLRPGGKVLISDLYVRQKPQTIGLDTLDAGLMTRDQWVELLEQSGFAHIQFVDSSKDLTEFVIRTIWKHGSLEEIFDCRQWRQAKLAKPGYFLSVATKGR
ncbi:MAG TPA: hypothetical protein DCZ10_03270 [Pelotomaculum sp.]|nr:hypothetical protein [Pelotomaculum sp.]